jgi:hypothetical protein
LKKKTKRPVSRVLRWRDAEQDCANLPLVQSGLFSDLGEAGGIFGYFPVQMCGTLHTGETVYFRARGKKASFEISSGDTLVLSFEHEFVGADPMYSSLLSGAKCVELIMWWLESYINKTLPAGDKSGETTTIRSQEDQVPEHLARNFVQS